MSGGDIVKASFFAQLLAALAGGLSGMILGATIGWASPVKQPLMDGLGVFKPFAVSSEDFSWIAALIPLGHLVGSLIGGPLCDLVGRRGSLVLAAVPNTAGWAIVSFSTSVPMLESGVFFAGVFGSGIIACAGHVYLNEIAETSIRGSLGVLFMTMSTIGVMTVNVIGPMTSVFGLSLYCSAVSAFLFLTMIFMPESPFYLLKKGDESKAKRALIRLRGQQYDTEKELVEIKLSVQKVHIPKAIIYDSKRSFEFETLVLIFSMTRMFKEEHDRMSFYEGFRTDEAKKSIFMGFTLVSLEALTGCNILSAYTTDLFQEVGVNINATVSVVIASIFPIIGTLISSLVVDRVGRRPLLMLTGSVNAISSFLIAIFFIVKSSGSDLSENEYFQDVPLVSVCIYLFFYAVGLGPVEWIYMAEIIPAGIRGPGASICCFGNGLLMFLVNFTYLYSVQGIGIGPTFCIYGSFSVVLLLFAKFVLIETKGKSFEEIQAELHKKRTT